MKTILENNKEVTKLIALFMSIFGLSIAYAQDSITLDAKVIQTRSVAINRTVTFERNDIYLTAKEGDGYLRINGVNFRQGIIEADIKGSNTPQRSFVGIAFHGSNDQTFEAVYFRPFNFENQERKSHSVQYIAHPTYTWNKLRSDSPGKYEAALNMDIKPDDWFHVRIHVKESTVDVYINDGNVPTLSVDRLSKTDAGWVGFWTGNSSDGWFRNIKLRSINN